MGCQMVADIHIIAAAPSHHALVAALAADCFDGTDGAGWPSADVRAFLGQPNVHAWLALLDQEDAPAPAGFAMCRMILDEAELLLIGVLPLARRRGIGAALLEAVLHTCRETAIARLHLEVRRDNTAARALYQQGGFTVSGRRPGYYSDNNGNHHDALILTCCL